MKKLYFFKSALLISISALLMTGCNKDDKPGTDTAADNRDKVAGTYPVKVTVAGMDMELYADLALAKNGENDLKASAAVAVPVMGEFNIDLVLSSLKEYNSEGGQDVTGYNYEIKRQNISIGGTDMVFDGTGKYSDYDGKVYKNSTVSFISFEIADAAGAITVKVESGTDPGPVTKEPIVLSGFAGHFPDFYYFEHSTYVNFWFYNGNFEAETGFDGAHEMFFVEANQPRVEKSYDYPGVAEGTYNPDSDYNGEPITYIMGYPLGQNGEVLTEPTGTFYRKVDAAGNTIMYYFTSGTFTVTGNKMVANMNGYVFDKEASDGKGEAVTDVRFEFEGDMGQDKFEGISPPPTDSYVFSQLMTTAYYSDFEVAGSGKFMINVANGNSPSSGNFIAASVIGFMPPAADPEAEGWVYPEPGIYNIADTNLPFTLVPGSVNTTNMSTDGTVFYRLNEHGQLGGALAIDGGYIEIIDMGTINEESGKKEFKIEFHLTCTEPSEEIKNTDQYVFEGPLWYIYHMPTEHYTLPKPDSFVLQCMGNYGTDGSAMALMDISAKNPETSNSQMQMKIGIYMEAQPKVGEGDITITTGTYTLATSRTVMNASAGSVTGSTVSTGGAFVKIFAADGYTTTKEIALERGQIEISYDSGTGHHTVEFKDVAGKNVKTWQPQTNVTFKWTGEINVLDFR